MFNVCPMCGTPVGPVDWLELACRCGGYRAHKGTDSQWSDPLLSWTLSANGWGREAGTLTRTRDGRILTTVRPRQLATPRGGVYVPEVSEEVAAESVEDAVRTLVALAIVRKTVES